MVFCDWNREKQSQMNNEMIDPNQSTSLQTHWP